eukprot:TRINITY_DN1418_c0_g1_i6.p1 TRINITY_DN1418_c0_g1~~TRINITY_DN1418_c0_g1_i6.p1  ORF type:complete len:364 (-),score=51.40 TRINITY_DN1418_c0_g1_i6:89-1180(-)
MDSSGMPSDGFRNNGTRRYSMRFNVMNIIQAPLSSLLEYTGIIRGHSHHHEGEASGSSRERGDDVGGGGAEVSIRIIGTSEQEHVRVGTLQSNTEQTAATSINSAHIQNDSGTAGVNGDSTGSSSLASVTTPLTINATSGNVGESDVGGSNNANGREAVYQRYDIQQLARWLEQILPFSLLLLVVFIRLHLQGFFITFWIAAIMVKSNDIVRKQTALKSERRILILIGIMLVFAMHVVCVYWWYRKDDVLYPLIMHPPQGIPPFWHALFIIVLNDTMVRQAAMIIKCGLLIYYKNSRGRSYRRQGQMLTLVEYILLLYRALLPTPVWYRFFLNKEYGSLFSSLTTGLYLTFKLTSMVEKVNAF